MDSTNPVYEIDARWKIVKASESFCRVFKCARSGIIGRDVRDLLRDDWRLDFRTYVARAMIGIGDRDETLPMVSPSGEHGWYQHNIEPVLEQGLVAGYRATIHPHEMLVMDRPKRWWEWRPVTPKQVWDFDADQLAQSG